MNLPIQMVSTDFDGTFHTEFESPRVPPVLQKLIGDLQADGVVWVINTGRELNSLMESMTAAQVFIRPDYVVTVERDIHVRNGSVYAPVEEWNTACSLAHQRLFDRVESAVPQVVAELDKRFSVQLFADAFSPLCLIAKNNRDADAVCEYLTEFFRSERDLTVVRNDIYGRLGHAEFNKGSALAEIGRRLGIRADQTVAAGDHLNDLPMLERERARWLIAPENAADAVKETVRRQNGYVSEERFGNGVERGLRHWLGRLANGKHLLERPS